MSDTIRGVARKLCLEGGLWALATDDGTRVALLGAPEGLRVRGSRVEVECERRRAHVSVGMVGDAVRVVSFRAL